MLPENQLILASAAFLAAGFTIGWIASARQKQREAKSTTVGEEPIVKKRTRAYTNAVAPQPEAPVCLSIDESTVADQATKGGKQPTAWLKTLPSRALHDVLQTKHRLESELSAAASIIERQAAQLRAAEREARIDAVTSLPNRRAFDEQIREVESLFERHQIAYSLVMFDLDKFKDFNDSFGHAAGDAVLRAVGKIFQSQRRPTDRAFRFGGEEFVLLCQATDARGAQVVAERIRRRIEESIVCIEGRELRVTTSAGVSQIRPGMSLRGLLEEADMALYIAKQQGRNRAYAPQVDDIAITPVEAEALA